MASQLAERLQVPKAKLAAFAEVYEAQGERGARRWEEFLRKVRSSAEVESRLEERPELLAPFEGKDAHILERAKQRLIFCGRYSAKVGTSLDEALESAASGLSAAAETAAKVGGTGRLRMTVAAGRFGDEHLACRTSSFPYRPSVSASHGSHVVEARTAEDTSAAGRGTLLGYAAMQGGGYVDDLAVEPAFHGQSVASALLAGCAAAELKRGCDSLSLDVRAANVPALELYRAIGFNFGALEHPGFLDWDGGYSGSADASVVLKRLPPSADISCLE